MGSEVDFGDLGLTPKQDAEVREVLSQWEHQRRRLAVKQMRLAAKAGSERRIMRGPDGSGAEVKMTIHPVSYHYWGQRLGYKCWKDPQFCREYLRDNPEARVKSRPDHPTLVVQGAGGLAAAGAKRFHKTYGAPEKTEDHLAVGPP